MKRVVVGALSAVLLAVGCSGDDDDSGASGDASAYVDVVAEQISADEAFPLDAEGANCVAAALVDVVGADELEAAGITPEEFADADNFADLDVEVPDDAVSQLGADFEACGVAGAVIEALAAEFQGALPTEAGECLEDAVDDRAAAVAMAQIFVDGSEPDFTAALADAVVACPDVMTAAMIDQAPRELTPEEQECVRGVVEANPDLIRSVISGDDPNAAQELGVQVATACPSVNT